MQKYLSQYATALTIACASTLWVATPSSAAPGPSAMAGLKSAVPDVATNVRWRGHGAPIVAGIAGGIIGAGIASAATPYYGGGYYPDYYEPPVRYAYSPAPYYGYGYAPTPYYSYAPYGYYRSYPSYAGYPYWGRGYYGRHYGHRSHWRHRHYGYRW